MINQNSIWDGKFWPWVVLLGRRLMRMIDTATWPQYNCTWSPSSTKFLTQHHISTSTSNSTSTAPPNNLKTPKIKPNMHRISPTLTQMQYYSKHHLTPTPIQPMLPPKSRQNKPPTASPRVNAPLFATGEQIKVVCPARIKAGCIALLMIATSLGELNKATAEKRAAVLPRCR